MINLPVNNLKLSSKTDNPEEFKVYNFIVNLDKPEIGDTQISFNTFTSGNGTMAIKRGATAIGQDTLAYGSNGFAGGKGSVAADVAMAFGLNTEAQNAGDVSFGNGNKSSGGCSFTSGSVNDAIGLNSASIGYQNCAKGKNSVTLGLNNTAIADNQIVVGKYGYAEEDDLFVIGNGAGSGDNVRNSFSIKTDNSIHFTGNIVADKNIADLTLYIPKINSGVVRANNFKVPANGGIGTSDGSLLRVDNPYITGGLYTDLNKTKKITPVYEWDFKYEFAKGKSYGKEGYEYTVDDGYVINYVRNTQETLILPDFINDDLHTYKSELIVGIITQTPGTGKSDYLHVKLPNGLKFIGDNVFYYGSFPSIELPDSLEYIGHEAFAYNTNLKTITIPKNVTYIAKQAFEGCSNLVFYVEPGSYGELYCKNNNKNYKYNKMDPILNELYIKSSTKDSNKIFKLTIDDNGQISVATDI